MGESWVKVDITKMAYGNDMSSTRRVCSIIILLVCEHSLSNISCFQCPASISYRTMSTGGMNLAYIHISYMYN